MIPSGSEYTSITANENTVYSPVDMEGKGRIIFILRYRLSDTSVWGRSISSPHQTHRYSRTVLYSVTRACTLRYTHSDTKDAIAIIPLPTLRTVSPPERGRSTNYQYCTYVPSLSVCLPREFITRVYSANARRYFAFAFADHVPSVSSFPFLVSLTTVSRRTV